LVNIFDVDVDDLKERFKDYDKLDVIFRLQKELAEKYGAKIPVDLNTKEGQEAIRFLTYCVIEELCESTNILKNRRWTKTELPVDKDHFYEELTDAVLFFVELLLVAGLTPAKVYELYLRKWKVNIFRIESGY